MPAPDHRVQLVDEQDDLSFLLGEVVQDRLQALLELATELGARNQRAHVERKDALAAQAFGHFVVDDALREAFDDGRLADAGLADQDRVVLRTALQDLDRAADLVVTTDDRVELALLCALRQVDGVLLERLPRVFGVRVVDLLPAADLVDRGFDRALHGTGLLENGLERRGVVQRREHEQLAGDVLVIPLLRQFVGQVEELVQVIGDMQFATGAFDFRQAVERVAQLRAKQVDVDAGLREQAAHGAALLVQQRHHDVGRLDELVVQADRQGLGLGERHLELAGQFVHSHWIGS